MPELAKKLLRAALTNFQYFWSIRLQPLLLGFMQHFALINLLVHRGQPSRHFGPCRALWSARALKIIAVTYDVNDSFRPSNRLLKRTNYVVFTANVSQSWRHNYWPNSRTCPPYGQLSFIGNPAATFIISWLVCQIIDSEESCLQGEAGITGIAGIFAATIWSPKLRLSHDRFVSGKPCTPTYSAYLAS